MERSTNKTKELDPVTKLHIIYGTIIMIISVASVITIMTMKSSYDNLAASVGMMSGSQQMPEGHPEVSDGAAAQSASAPGGGAGGMPPFVKKMLEKYKGALDKNPNDIEALTGLGNMYYDSQQFAKAIDYYEKALKVKDTDSNIRADLATCYFYTNNSAKAIENYKVAIENDPKNLNARYNLGIVYKTIGEKDKARESLEAMKPYLTTDAEKKKLQEEIEQLGPKA